MKSVILFIGPKGSGKTTIGKQVAKNLDAVFLDVEKLLIDYAKKNSIHSSAIPKHGFDIEFNKIKDILSKDNIVVAEATGSSEFLSEHINNIEKSYQLIPIKIECSFEVCMNRIKNRGHINNFKVKEEDIIRIFEKTRLLELDWAHRINTTTTYDISDLCAKITKLLNH